MQHQIAFKHRELVSMKPLTIYKCNYKQCDKSYLTLSDINRHKKTHFKPFKCKQCNSRFAAKWDLKIHSRIHNKNKYGLHNINTSNVGYINNNENKQQCKYCMKIFTDPSNLRKHIQTIHALNKNLFICKICHKQFNRKDSLQRHWKTHSNQIKNNKWHCKHCNVRFSYKYNLNKHNKKYHQ